MDEIVLQAMIRWPNVPAVYGWLKLDIRGRWLLKNSPITNTTMRDFIDRNYVSNDKGQWYFQNGPQKVFVELEYTPYVLRVWRNSNNELFAETHTKQVINTLISCWVDENGNLLLESEIGIGVIEPQSLPILSSQLINDKGFELSEQTLNLILAGNTQLLDSVKLQWNDLKIPLQFLEFKKISARFRFDPFPLPGNEKCL